MDFHELIRPVLRHFRTKRMRLFRDRFRLTPQSRVLDVGGFLYNWSLLPERPRLTIVNLVALGVEGPGVAWVVADGRRLPFKDRAFDIVYSNSVIEHVGDFDDKRLFAMECGRVGVSYYVQTPNRRFPVEPHLVTPLIHWLPIECQRRLLRNFTVRGLISRPTVEECEELLRIRLLGQEEMRVLFPDGEIWHERVMGMTKSLIAVRIVPPERE